MGCISSKHARSKTKSPAAHSSVSVSFVDNGSRILDSSSSSQLHHLHSGFGPLEKIKEEPEKEEDGSVSQHHHHHGHHGGHSGNSKELKKGASAKRAAISFRIGRVTEGEHVAAGWPAWLSASAHEAVEGWLPLRSDNFERLEKIGQGTYSSVYRARDITTGRMVALKKVKFDNFQPESIRFMAREIMILRKLDHPNIMKLEGVITSRLSYTVYLVFEYMEHDLAGLLSCPGIKFTESQIKCYMRQLLCGLEHCHSRGILHRDIKTSNVLVNNEGILKIGDFGLANFLNARSKQALTSRVVTLWYRPPELLLGSTSYGLTVDLWSVGCVFAELFIGRPLLKGRTEVEQLHKIFKLCGSPPDEYWRHSKLPLATMFKPQHPYESVLRERCKEFPKSAVNLIETFLSIEPYKRGTASAGLESEYFTTKPYACDPSSLPRYPPNKEIDAKFREEARRRKVAGTARVSGATRNPRRVRKSLQEPSNFCKVVPSEDVDAKIHVSRINNSSGSSYVLRGKGATVARISLKPLDTVSEASQMTEESQGDRDSIRSVPIDMTTSSNFSWANRRKHDTGTRLYRYPTSRSQKLGAFDPSSGLQEENLDWIEQENDDFSGKVQIDARGYDEIAWHGNRKQRLRHHQMDSFESSEGHKPAELTLEYDGEQGRVHSGPLLYQSQSHRIDARQDSQIHHMVRKSRFSRDLQ